MSGRKGFLLGAAAGVWFVPLVQSLVNVAAGRGLLYPKENR